MDVRIDAGDDFRHRYAAAKQASDPLKAKE
jgi:hypothetical protein